MNAHERGSADRIGDAVIDPAAKLWPISCRCDVGTHPPHVACLTPQRKSGASCGSSVLEISIFGGPAGDAGAVRTTTQLFHSQRVEALHHLLLEIEPERTHDTMAERASRGVADRIFRGFEPLQRPHDVAEAYPPPFTRQTIAATWTSDAKKDLIPDQFLEHRLEVAARDALPLGNLRGAHGGLTTVVGDVEHRLDSEQQFLG